MAHHSSPHAAWTESTADVNVVTLPQYNLSQSSNRYLDFARTTKNECIGARLGVQGIGYFCAPNAGNSGASSQARRLRWLAGMTVIPIGTNLMPMPAGQTSLLPQQSVVGRPIYAPQHFGSRVLVLIAQALADYADLPLEPTPPILNKSIRSVNGYRRSVLVECSALKLNPDERLDRVGDKAVLVCNMMQSFKICWGRLVAWLECYLRLQYHSGDC